MILILETHWNIKKKPLSGPSRGKGADFTCLVQMTLTCHTNTHVYGFSGFFYMAQGGVEGFYNILVSLINYLLN